MSSPFLVMNRVGSIEPLENPLDTRKLESSSDHAFGACLSPYNAFLRRGSLKNGVLTSIWYTGNDLCAAYATNNQTASNRATGAIDSWKLIPSYWLVVYRLIPIHLIDQTSEVLPSSLQSMQTQPWLL
ncbi:hypothetical protein Tco_0794600 [Tanacetum coccineum]